MSGFAEELRRQTLERQARAALAEAERLAAVMATAGDPPPARLAAKLEAACDLADRLWLEYSLAGPEAAEPKREAAG